MFQVLFKQFYILKFIIFNNKNIIDNKIDKNKISPKILIEINNNFSSHIIIHYLIRVFNKKKNYEYVGFLLNIESDLIFLIKHFLKKIIPTSIYKIYESFGIRTIISFYEKKSKNEEIIASIINKTCSLDALLNLRINNIYIGDLIYDSYLRQKKKITININDNEFKKFFKKFLKYFFNCYNYFETNNIEVLFVSHTVYQNAVPLRIALDKKIKCYLPNINVVDYFDDKRNTNWDFDAINQNFKQLNNKEKKEAIDSAKKNLEKKFDPKNKDYVAEIFLTGRKFKKEDFKTFKKNFRKDILARNGKKNFLISAHCFFDSPHVMGNFFYYDFYHWLDNLGKISETTNYNWYLKTHPHTIDNNLNFIILKKFEKKYKNFYLLDKDVSNMNLISEGVDLVLSVYGSVAYEFPYHKIPVLLASNECIYKDQLFCMTPKNKEEYEFLLRNPDKINLDFNRDNIYKFFYSIFMNFWDPLKISENKFNHKTNFFSPEIYNLFMKKYFSKENELIILRDLEQFLKSKNYRIFTK